MKKFILTTFLFAMSTLLSAQVGPVDFEAGGNGADWTWRVFESETPALEIIENPDATGANTSAKVAKFTAPSPGANYAGTTTSGIGTFAISSDNPVIKIMVWKSVISDVGIKLEAADGWSEGEIKVANTKTGEWEELTFDFSSKMNPPAEKGSQFTTVTVFPDFRARDAETVIYFDNITFDGFQEGAAGGGGGGGGGAATYCDTEVTHLGIPAETPSAIKLTINNVDANSMMVSITSANDDPVDELVIPGDVTGSPTISAKDESVAGTISVTLTWGATPPAEVALNILWSKVSFGGNWQLAEQPVTVQFAGVCDGSGGGGEPGEVVEVTPIDFEADGNGADWTWEVFGGEANPVFEIIDNPDATGGNTSAKVAKITVAAAGASWSGTTSAGIGAYLFDAEAPIIKVMVWKSVISNVGVKLEAVGGWSQGEVLVANTKTDEWEELTFDFTGKVNPPVEEGGAFGKVTIFPDFTEGRGQENVIYFDNIVFTGFNSLSGGGNGGGGGADAPTAAAPAPDLDAANVISLHSSPFTDVTVDTWRTDWSATSYEEVTIDGRATKKYSSLDFVGIETVANQVNASEMTHFHVHVWSADFTQFSVKLVDFGADGAFGGGDDTEHQIDVATPATGEWVSMAFPLSDFTNMTSRSNIAQYIFVGQPTGATTVFMDNILFFNDENNTSIEEPAERPNGFALSQNYPNPFNPTTTINYNIAESNNVTLEVFSIHGQRVATLVSGVQSAGAHSITFDASNLASGMYTYRLTSGNSVIVKKMMLLK